MNKERIKARFSGRRRPTVCHPASLERGELELWGYHIEESNFYNVIATCEPSLDMGGVKPTLLGHFHAERPQEIPEDELVGFYDGSHVVFIAKGERVGELNLKPYQLKLDIFSRNTGILESDAMLGKGAVIIGCGSVGSLVALELARAGVGRFFLVDMDLLEYHNICRHQCGIQDVGKYKATALRERILQVNPTARVETSNLRIQEVALDAITPFCDGDSIMVGCADNREGDLYACQVLAKPNGMPFIFIGCWERAFAGEIFYCLPEGMPDYSDFMAALGDSSGRVNANTHVYMGEVGSFEPGISADINFVTTIAVKMMLDLLNRDNGAYTQRLVRNLSQYTLVCNTNDPRIGGDMAEIFSYPLQVTTNIDVAYADGPEARGLASCGSQEDAE